MIPDVPSTIQNQIDRENLITQKALWQTKPVNSSELAKAKANSNLFLNCINVSSINNATDFDEKLNENDNLIDYNK
jgi:hypothetical protein